MSLDPKNEAKKVSFSVQEGGTLEVTLARFWSSDGFGGAKWDIEFGGVTPASRRITLGAHPQHLELKASVPESVSPAAKFERVCLPLVPSDFAINKVILEKKHIKPKQLKISSETFNINLARMLTVRQSVGL